MSAARRKQSLVFVVSDSSGASASHSLRAVGELFAGLHVDDRRHALVRTIRRIREIVYEAREHEGCILYTFASPELREEMRHLAQQNGVLAVDHSGSLIGMLEAHSGIRAAREPLHADDDHWLEAVQFFRHCEDGQQPQKLLEAEVVLVGASRTKKTPTNLHLVMRGIRASNCPLVLCVTPPRELFGVPRDRVFALTMRPSRLMEYRLNRMPSSEHRSNLYVDRGHIILECRMVKRMITENGWREIDVTSMGSEEVAGRVIEFLKTDNGTV